MRSQAGRGRRRAGAACLGWLLAAGLPALSIGSAPAAALPLVIEYGDPPGQGFADAELGEARRRALEHAAGIWADLLAGDVPVAIDATMPSLGGSGAEALLAQTGAVTLHRDFPGARPDIWYAAALANQLGGEDVNGESFPEIEITFNGDVDGAVVLGSVRWYYGLDSRAGFDVDFVTVALHELGHGLNFFDLIDPATGAPSVGGSLGIFEQNLYRPGVGQVPDLLAPERLAALTSGALFWNGPNVLEAMRAAVPVYAPPLFVSGQSISHWNTSLDPDELIEPFYTAPNHDPGLLLPALADMGWELVGPTPTPRSTAAIEPTPTPTRAPTSTPTPSAAPGRHAVYVANFDSDTVSVITGGSDVVARSIPVEGGPLGVAATPDGERIYVTSFHTGTLTEISARTREVTRVIQAGESAHSVALPPAADRAYVTDTYVGRLAVVDLVEGELRSSIEVGLQPVGVAAAPDGRRVYVASFGNDTVSVVDTELESVVAIVKSPGVPSRKGPLDVAISRRGRFYCDTRTFDESVGCTDTRELDSVSGERRLRGAPEQVAIAPDEREAYATLEISLHTSLSRGRLLVFDPRPSASDRREPVQITVGEQPVGVAVSPDGALVYVANSGSGTVSVYDTSSQAIVGEIEVGSTPMGVAVAPLPPPACAGDCRARGNVGVDDLILGVRIALGRSPLVECESIDANGDGEVSIDELVVATRNALGACGAFEDGRGGGGTGLGSVPFWLSAVDVQLSANPGVLET